MVEKSRCTHRASLEGRTFDVVECIDRVLADRSNFTLPEILYSVEEPDAAGELEFIAQAIDNYQRAMEIFRYNMFNKGKRTEVKELSGRVREALIGALVKKDGTLRMKEGK